MPVTKSIRFLLSEVLRVVRILETENRRVVVGGWGGRGEWRVIVE